MRNRLLLFLFMFFTAALMFSGCLRESERHHARAEEESELAENEGQRQRVGTVRPRSTGGSSVRVSADSARAAAGSGGIPSVKGVPDINLTVSSVPDKAAADAAREANKAGMKAFRSRDWPRAIDLLIQALKSNPDFTVARYNLARAFARSGDRERALGVLEQLKAADCEHCRAYLTGVSKDRDFASLEKDPRFEAVLLDAGPDRIALDEKVWKEQEKIALKIEGLPAVSRDGKRVVVAHQQPSPSGDLPDLKLAFLSVEEDRVVRIKQVIRAGTRPSGSRVDLRRVKDSLAKANRALIGTIWIPLVSRHADDVMISCDGEGDKQTIDIKGMKIIYSEPRLTVKKGDKSVVEESFRTWSSQKYCQDNDKVPPGHKQCGKVCVNHAFMKAAYVDDTNNVLLVELGYCGTDMCPSPEIQYHVIKLKK